MKYLKTYEGIRDQMTPKSEDDIRKTLEYKTPEEKIKFGTAQDLTWLVKLGIEEGVDIHMNDEYILKWVQMKDILIWLNLH